MILDVKSTFSNKQDLSKSANFTVSQDSIDLGEYHVRSGYAVAADTAAGLNSQPKGNTSNLVEGDSPVALGRGYYKINRKFGTVYMPFLCQVVEDIVEGSMTGLDVEFRVRAAEIGDATLTQAQVNAATLVATQRIVAQTAGRIRAGEQIPWPSFPRFVRERYLFLVYKPVGGSGGVTSGKISAGFTLDVPTFG